MQADSISMEKGWKLKVNAWRMGVNQNKGLMSFMAKKQECHLEYYCGKPNTAEQILLPYIFFLFTSQRPSCGSILRGKNNVKSFFFYCLRLPFFFFRQELFYYLKNLKMFSAQYKN